MTIRLPAITPRSWLSLPAALLAGIGMTTSAAALQPSGDGRSISFLGTGRLSGTTTDLSGLGGMAEDETPIAQFGGVSAIDWIPGTSRFLVASDRGPKDGAVTWPCRFHEIEVGWDEKQQPVSVFVTATALLTDCSGLPYSGSQAQLTRGGEFAGRLDPEGLRFTRGTVWISDEYGPRLMQFSPAGRLISELAVPDDLLVRFPSADPAEEDARNGSGRRANRGMEGLAATPDGRYLVGLMQSTLIQDGQIGENGKLTGLHARLVRFDLETGAQEQFVYRQEKAGHKLHEILAIDADRFLVIEQDGEGGLEAKFKKLFLIDVSKATRLPDGCRLGPEELPEGIQAAGKLEYLDLLDPAWGLAGPEMPEKIEGLSWGPPVGDGRRMLVVATDNDFRAEQDSLLYFFAVPQGD